MNVLLGLCFLLAAGLYRAPLPADPALPDTGIVWVYFTDKGIRTEAELDAAAAALELAAPTEVRERRRREARPGYDHDDLPVREEYIRTVERLGLRRRAVSRWLNAASFRVPPGIATHLHRLPFVHSIRPVGRETRLVADEAVPLPGEPRGHGLDQRPGPEPTGQTLDAPGPRIPDISALAVDSATAHRFYGPSFDQAMMMGVPDLFYAGWYGTGVRLAIFDTGLRLDNVAVRNLRISAQRDLLSGDNFRSASAGSGWRPTPAERLRFFGLVKDPAVVKTADGDLLVFCADSFNYAADWPRRAIFASTNPDRGATWSEPEVVVLSVSARQDPFNTFENLRLADAGFACYLAYGEVAYSPSAGIAGTAWLRYRQDGNWRPDAVRLGPGRRPELCLRDSTLSVAWVENDSVVAFRSGPVSEDRPLPTWNVSSTAALPEALDRLALAAHSGGVLVVASGLRSGRLYALRSTNLGASWDAAQAITVAAPTGFRLVARGPEVVLLVKDVSTPPHTRLTALRSSDLGVNWSAPVAVTDNTLTIGGITAAWPGERIELIYESAGLLHRTGSADGGLSFGPSTPVDTLDYTHQPALTPDGGLAVWHTRGDDKAVWEPADTARFFATQPDHGTRMASIIAGYSPSGIVGVAPGVELLVARTELHRTRRGHDYEYQMEEDTYIEALEWAEARGADIVSTSLGYRGWYTDAQMDGRTAPISVAATLAARRGMVVVTAMGNRDTTRYPFSRPYIVAPADAEDVVSAGGVQRDGSFWRGTGTGPTADGRCKPELVALSDTVAVARPDTVTGLEGSAGTSCATALIAGAFALLKEAHPEWSAESLKAVMFETATGSVPGCTFGFGIPRVDEAFRRHPPSRSVRPLPASRLGVFPNPYIAGEHERVWFRLELARPVSRAAIRIYSASGTLVDSLSLNAELLGRPGRYSKTAELEQIGAWWDGTNSNGRPVASGLYLAVLQTTFDRSVGRFAVVR